DGQRLISASRDETIRVWDATPLFEGERQELRTYKHHSNEIWSLAVRPKDRQMIVSGGFATSPTVWDPETGREMFTIPGQSGVVFCVAWSPDGQWVASDGGGVDNVEFTLKVINPHDRSKDFELQSRSEYMALAFHPDGNHLVTGQQDGSIRVWDLRT